MAAVEEQFRRMVFNVVARNQDDHVMPLCIPGGSSFPKGWSGGDDFKFRG